MNNVMFETSGPATQSRVLRLGRVLWLGAIALAAACLLGCDRTPSTSGSTSGDLLVVSASGIPPGGSVDIDVTDQDMMSSWDVADATNGPTSGGTIGDHDIWIADIVASPQGALCSITAGPGYEIASDGSASGQAVGPITVTVVCVPAAQTIGGTVTGLQVNNKLLIQDNGGDDYIVSSMAGPQGSPPIPFTFPTPIPIGGQYAVTIMRQAAEVPQNCPLTNGSGQVSSSGAITNIVISCGADTYNLTATVSGLVPGDAVALSDVMGQALTAAANGLQYFPLPEANGAGYQVVVATQPAHGTCTVTNGSGTLASAPANVTVTCTPALYPVSVSVSGLPAGDSLTLQDNAADNLTITSNGSFNFNTELSARSPYAVTSLSVPPGESCPVTMGSGTIDPSNPAVATVDCTAAGANAQYNIGVTVTGLDPGQTLVLQNNGADNLTVQGTNNPVTMNFATPVGGSTAPYAITILTQPSGEGCAVGEGSGTVSTSDVTIAVTCSAQISGIEVMPANPSAPVGTTQQFTALGLFTEGGSEDLTRQATWSSSDTGVAPINAATGLATIIAPGSSTIQAQVTVAGQPYAATTTLTGSGSGVMLTSITVSPANASITAPGTLQYSATGVFSNANSVDISPWVTWSALPSGTASITATGQVTGIAAGSATVSASLQPEGQALVSGNTGLTVAAAAVAACPSQPYLNPTYCGTVSVTDSYGDVYTGTFYFILIPGGPTGVADQISTCSVTIAPTSSPTDSLTAANSCSGQVDNAGNLLVTVSGASFDATLMGTVVNGTTSGTATLPNAPEGGTGNGTFAGTMQ